MPPRWVRTTPSTIQLTAAFFAALVTGLLALLVAALVEG